MIYNNYYMCYPFLPPNCDKPPTLYSILNSIVNGEKEEEDYSKIKNLAKEGRNTIFNFDYDLSEKISKEKFETMILNHFLMRRIGFDTVTAFRIQLSVKINEIMPLYNKMFDMLDNWDLFEDGDTTVRTGTDNRTTKNTLENHSNNITHNLSDRRNSELPQDQLQDLRDGSYVTNYNYDNDTADSQDNSNSEGHSQDENIYSETIKRSQADRINIYKEAQENFKNIFTMIFKDLECLFYQVI